MVTIQERNKIFKQAQHGSVDQLKLVHQQHPDFHWSVLSFEKSGDTVIHMCSELGYFELIDYLLGDFEPNGVDCRNSDDKTALHVAAQFSQYECCKTLLKHGADVNAIKRADWTPLMLACTKTSKDIHPKDTFNTVKLLLSHGALVNLKNKDGWTVLHLVSREGDLEILNLLLTAGADPSVKTKNGRTVTHIAALHGNLDVVKMWVDLGLYVEEKDNCGNTPLQEALLGKHLKVCKFLIDSGANVSCQNFVGFGLIHLAACVGELETIQFVLNIKNHRFDIKEPNINGWTPLHCAARKNFIEAYSFLVENGADETVKDSFGRIAKQYFSNK